MRFFSSTNRGLEDVASREISRLVDATPDVHHPGVVTFEAAPSAVYTLHKRARTLHRVLIERLSGECDSLDEIEALARDLDVRAIFEPTASFAVRAQRHGDQPFGSPDVEEVVGQAIIDRYWETDGERPPVDLDDPDVIFRVFVRHSRVIITVDGTGQRSLHRRLYREREHDAALRPTVAASMLLIAGYDGTQRLVDPMCGAGTIPIEAALLADGREPTPDHEPAFGSFRLLSAVDEPEQGDTVPDTRKEKRADILAADHSDQWIQAARENARAAGVGDLITATQQDATAGPVEGELIVTDLPFGIRTESSNIAGLYASFFDSVENGSWDRMVLLTTRNDLVPFEPTATHDIRRGKIEASILVLD